MAGTSLAEVFALALPAGVRVPAGDVSAALAAVHEAGALAWPSVEVDPGNLARWLAARAAPPEARLPDVSLAADVYLACACVADAPGAVVAFDRAFGPLIARVAGRIDRSPAFADETAQTVREKLFVAGDGSVPKIAEYAGRAPLRVWLRAVTARSAVSLRRGKDGAGHDPIEPDDARLVAGAGADPEVRLAKAHHKAVVEEAVRAAIEQLTPKDRTLLRLHLVEGVSIDVLGAHYQVGRSTAARWLAAARDALRRHTRSEIAARLGAADPSSVLAFVRSQLEISAVGLLGDASGDDRDERAVARKAGA